MPHNICTGGCKGVSDTPGVCQTEGCAKHDQPLIECSCGDGNHDGMASPDDITSDDDATPKQTSSEG